MFYLSGIFLIFLFLFFYFSRFYHSKLFQDLDKKEHKLYFIYPTCCYIIDKFPIQLQTRWKQKYIRALKDLYIGCDLEQVYLFYLCKKVSILLLLLFLINFMAFIVGISEIKQEGILKGTKIERLNYGEGSQSVKLEVTLKNREKDKEDIKGKVQFEINERRYTENELALLIEKVKQYININILGENNSFEDISKPLHLIKSYPDSSIQISWDLGNDDLIQTNGSLKNENIEKEGKLTCIIAHIKYYNTKVDYPIYLRIMPKIISKEERIFSNLNKLIMEKEEQSLTEQEFSLPDEMKEYNLYFYEKKSDTIQYIYILGIVMIIIVSIILEKEITQKQRERETQLLIDYPEIVNKFVLLLGAGMTMRGAWGKIISEYEDKRKQQIKKKRYAYEELLVGWNEMTNGVSEIRAFENFGKRVKLLPYLKFSSLISQNLKKGTADLLYLLQIEAVNAFEQRKDLTKKMGEEAGTKLLFPMMIMLLIVLMIVMIPAFMSF